MSRVKNFFRILITVISFFHEAEAQKDDPWKPLTRRSDWSVATAHSHNDYQQIHPFTSAYQAGFGSLEADILLYHDSLFVGHSESDIRYHRLLSALYLDSIRFYCRINDGYIYKDKSRSLQLLIDIKTKAELTLAALMKELEKYPDLIHSPSVFIVITGNRPASEKWDSFPSYIYFDGDAGKNYKGAILGKVAMISGNFASYSLWKGTGDPDTTTFVQLNRIINEAHRLGRKIRFWNAPDNVAGWQQLIAIGVDWINTDHIDELASFLRQQ
jgi:alkaline phosphatase